MFEIGGGGGESDIKEKVAKRVYVGEHMRDKDLIMRERTVCTLGK